MGMINEAAMEEVFWSDLKADYPVLKAEKVKISTKSIGNLVKMAYIAGRAQGRLDAIDIAKGDSKKDCKCQDIPEAGDIEMDPEAKACSAYMSGKRVGAGCGRHEPQDPLVKDLMDLFGMRP